MHSGRMKDKNGKNIPKRIRQIFSQSLMANSFCDGSIFQIHILHFLLNQKKQELLTSSGLIDNGEKYTMSRKMTVS